jgi:hypothetical protein
MLVRHRRFLTSIPGVSVSEAARQAQEVGEAAVGEQSALEEALAAANRDIEILVEYVQDLQAQLDSDHDATDNPGDSGSPGASQRHGENG